MTRKYFAVLILLAAASLSCKKQQVYDSNPAVLQVVNALEDGVMLYANLSGTHPIQYDKALSIPNKQFTRMNIIGSVQPMAFYGSKDTLPESTAVWSRDLQLGSGKMHTLFLFGEQKTPGHLLIENNYPGFRTDDSVTNVRFANMSNGQPVSVNLKGKPAGSLPGNLAYKEISTFIALKADKSVDNYEFEFRDAATGTLLCTFLAPGVNNYSLGQNIYLNRSWMLVLVGKPGGTGVNALSITKVDNR